MFEKGNSLLDNIEFEEWSLKGLDKDLGPDLWPIKSGDTTATQAGKANVKVEAQGLVSDTTLPVCPAPLLVLFPTQTRT